MMPPVADSGAALLTAGAVLDSMGVRTPSSQRLQLVERALLDAEVSGENS